MMPYEIRELLGAHRKWLNCENGGVRADLSCADLSGANLSDADLRRADLSDTNLRRADLSGANLSGADLSDTDLSGANLSGANLSDADLSGANLSGANLSDADLRRADLSDTDLSCADLSGANLSDADLRRADLSDADLSDADLRRADLSDTNLRRADLSGADGLLSAIDYMGAHFERTADGYVAYKVFGVFRRKLDKWEIRPGAVITENVNTCRTNSCGCGVNVATQDWVKGLRSGNDIWKVLIRWEWLCGICVPYNSQGQIRCERVELIEIVKEAGADET